MKRWSSWLLILPSIIIGVVLFELAFRLISPSSDSEARVHRLIYFFDGPGTVFRDYGETFTYVLDSKIRVVTIFYSDDHFGTEYDYFMHTNNFGLVEDADIVPGQPSLLVLGDSFTEGVGAEPWFRTVSPEIAKLGYQPINGGIGGTGFSSWRKLEQNLTAADIDVKKLVVLFISDDYRRPAWNVTPGELRCFADLSRCRVQEGVFFRYRLPPAGQLPTYIAKIRAARQTTLRARGRALLPGTYRVYENAKQLFRPSPQAVKDERGEKESRSAIDELIKTYGSGNVAFLHLPVKEELDKGPGELGVKARRTIQQAGGKLFDGFRLCGLVAGDYHPHDLHPNSRGYAKIAACTLNVIQQITDRPDHADHLDPRG